jgi:hypothetical protein
MTEFIECNTHERYSVFAAMKRILPDMSITTCPGLCRECAKLRER